MQLAKFADCKAKHVRSSSAHERPTSFSPALTDAVQCRRHRCALSLRTKLDQRVIVVAGLSVITIALGTKSPEAYAMVFLVGSRFAQQTDVARAFDRSVPTIGRYQRRYLAGGMAAALGREGWRRS